MTHSRNKMEITPINYNRTLSIYDKYLIIIFEYEKSMIDLISVTRYVKSKSRKTHFTGPSSFKSRRKLDGSTIL